MNFLDGALALTNSSAGVLVLILMAGVSTWRISHMLVYEYGPFGTFQSVRSAFGIAHHVDGSIASFSHRNVLNCVWCSSVWLALVISLVLMFLPRFATLFIVIFFMMSVPPLIELLTEWLHADRSINVYSMPSALTHTVSNAVNEVYPQPASMSGRDVNANGGS